jgi:hypothetical protein
MAETGEPRTYPKFLSLAKIGEIARELKLAGHESTVTPDEARALVNCYVTWRDRVKAFLKVLSHETACRSCGKAIYWVVTKNGKRAPYTAEGISHFADCPNAAQHRAGKD